MYIFVFLWTLGLAISRKEEKEEAGDMREESRERDGGIEVGERGEGGIEEREN